MNFQTKTKTKPPQQQFAILYISWRISLKLPTAWRRFVCSLAWWWHPMHNYAKALNRRVCSRKHQFEATCFMLNRQIICLPGGFRLETKILLQTSGSVRSRRQTLRLWHFQYYYPEPFPAEHRHPPPLSRKLCTFSRSRALTANTGEIG